jgi:Domain of unknown function (DUF6249)
MYCPNCAAEENQPKQFCRNCGTDLRGVRSALEKPDTLTASAASARNEIGSAIALKIKELKSSRDLQRLTEEVLPQISRFLESPEEKRLRVIRTGVINTAIGLGIFLLFGIVGIAGKNQFIIPALAGFIPFLIGIGLIINGLFFTVPRKKFSMMESQELLNPSPIITKELMPEVVSSVVEHTTHRLPERNN